MAKAWAFNNKNPCLSNAERFIVLIICLPGASSKGLHLILCCSTAKMWPSENLWPFNTSFLKLLLPTTNGPARSFKNLLLMVFGGFEPTGPKTDLQVVQYIFFVNTVIQQPLELGLPDALKFPIAVHLVFFCSKYFFFIRFQFLFHWWTCLHQVFIRFMFEIL